MQGGAYRSAMGARRRAVSTVATASVVVVVAATLIAAAVVYSRPAATITSLSVSTVTNTGSPLITYSADAYAAEVSSLLNGFASSTGAQVAPVKSGGSFADASEIAAGAPDDVFVSVALSATSSQYLRNLTSNWAIGFASDQMVLAYSDAPQTSAAASVISLANTAARSNATSDWDAFFTALTSGGVKLGISDPASDPAGIRGWLVLEVAGYLYSGGNQQAYVSPLLQGNANVTGTNAAALVAPLQAGQIQFLFVYKSAAVSDGLRFLSLDSHVNLGSPSLGSFYSKFSYADSAGRTPAAPIILCVTVPLSAVNTAEALQFVQYVVQNSKSLSSSGLEPFPVAMLYNNVLPPAPLQALVSQGLVAEAGALP